MNDHTAKIETLTAAELEQVSGGQPPGGFAVVARETEQLAFISKVARDEIARLIKLGL